MGLSNRKTQTYGLQWKRQMQSVTRQPKQEGLNKMFEMQYPLQFIETGGFYFVRDDADRIVRSGETNTVSDQNKYGFWKQRVEQMNAARAVK